MPPCPPSSANRGGWGQVGHEFEAVEALWTQFEGVMGRTPDMARAAEKEGDGGGGEDGEDGEESEDGGGDETMHG